MKLPAFFALGALVATAAVTASAQDTAGRGATSTQPRSGAALFQQQCGICHLEGGTGTFMLARRLGQDNALLTNRTNLTDAYLRVVVRQGQQSMPRFTRVELPDDDLELIIAYLVGNSRESRR